MPFLYRTTKPYCGSSPRMWGTSFAWEIYQGNGRFIPTHVGNIVEHHGKFGQWPVHPHACGEHCGRGGCHARSGGSSPRMWGTSIADNYDDMVERFIPTHVGNISAADTVLVVVHPHMWEHLSLTVMIGPCAVSPRMWGHDCRFNIPTPPGSSPRMWGTSQFCPRRNRLDTVIPTHVGNIKYHNLRQTLHGSPHACGNIGHVTWK